MAAVDWDGAGNQHNGEGGGAARRQTARNKRETAGGRQGESQQRKASREPVGVESASGT